VTVELRRSWAKDLDASTLYELLKLRVEVFVVEQATPYPELDGRDLDADTRHFWLESPDGKVISTLRLMEEHPGGEKAFRIGRVCTKRTERGHGHSNRLMLAALAEVGDFP
jgi:ElaA protein